MFVSTNYKKNIRGTWITGQNNTLLGTQYTEMTTTATATTTTTTTTLDWLDTLPKVTIFRNIELWTVSTK